MAVYPVAASHPDLSGSYIPRLYAAQLLIEFYEHTLFGSIANTDYEGQIQNQGDTVVIRALPNITIRDYVKGQTLVYENPAPSSQNLLIDKGKYMAFGINDVDRLQSDLDYQGDWANHGAKLMKIEVDTGILADIAGDIHASNTGLTAGKRSSSLNLGVAGTPVTVSKDSITEKLVDCGTALDEQDVPEEGRWIALPPAFVAMIKKSDLKDASLAGDGTSILRNGLVGQIDRFMVYSSNLLDTVSGDSATKCLFGHKVATTFAAQMTKSETLRNPNDFGDLLRSLMIYGYKVVKPEALGLLYATS